MTHEWVHIQVSQILVKKEEPLKVFLAYLTDPKTGKTFFDMMKAQEFKMLPAGKSEPNAKYEEAEVVG
jgi:hypothetical protein